MKNVLIIDLDTERENALIFAKPEGVTLPTNKDEASTMMLEDIKTLTEALSTMIALSDANGFHTRESLVEAVMKHLNYNQNDANGTH
jgi:hypothetical protein